ncbi:MAG: alpha/beta fold hydrolase [Pyrinomonadaceae bacterium]
MTLCIWLTAGSVFAAKWLNPADDCRCDKTEVSFSNGPVKLAATLLIPESETGRKSPAVVFVHGSGSSDRSNAWTGAYADGLARRGIIVLYPDKRGSGKSGGDWLTSSFLDLSDDAVAGVEFLKKDERVDPDRLGLIGFSQGGDIVPAAAVRSDAVKFVIDISGSVVPIFEQIMDEVEMSAEREGLTRKQIEIVNEINRKALRAALTGKGGEEYLKALQQAKNGDLKGFKVIENFPDEADPPAAKFIRAIGNFDPMPYWKKLKIPLLFLYGGEDKNLRVHKSVRLIEENLGSGDYNYSVLLFNQNGHGVFRQDSLDFIGRWIEDGGAK